MKIVVAKTAGFCFGVERAVDLAFENSEGSGIYTYGPIIHNELVTNELERKGVIAIDDLEKEDVSKIIIRSHGVSPNVYKIAEERGINVVDATCPYVRKIHRYVLKYHDQGYGVIIAGDKKHPEVIGINGWADNGCIIVKNVEELKEVDLDKYTKYLLVAQTTYKKEIVNNILEYLETKSIELKYINTICNATRDRQEEVREIATQVDCMIVIGSKKSSNSLKLFEISQASCKKSYFISESKELNKDMFKDIQSVGITAGASTPSGVIKDTVEFVKNLD